MKTTRRAFLGHSAAAGLMVTLSTPRIPADIIPSAVLQSIGDAIAKAIKSGACPGVAIELSYKGSPMFHRGFGSANLETGSPVTETSVYRIGSLTKQFTAAMVIKLCLQGKLKLDDPVGSYLPSFVSLQPVTLSELLQHTGGIHSDEESTQFFSSSDEKTQLHLAEDISRQKKVFDFAPGTAWLYSNANYVVLGAVIEQVSGESLRDAAQELIVEPLHLTATSFDRSADVVPGRVSGYSPQPGSNPPFVNAPYIPISEAGGAGAMRSTVVDLCRWHYALLTAQLFPASFVELMMTPGRLRDGSLSGSRRFSANDAAMGDTQYGMGLLLPPSFQNHRSILHYGAIEGFAACLETYVDLKLTLAILCNGDNNPDLPFRAVRKIVQKQILATIHS